MKKLLSLAITICFLCGMCVNISAASFGEDLKNAPVKTYKQKFSDVPETHWAFGYIAEMSERGVLSGYPDGKFYPDSQVTRAEFAKIMTTAAGLSVTQPTAQLFADVQISQWYAPYVHTAKEYLSAYSQGGASYYLPNTPALREDIAVALVKLKGYSTTGADVKALQRMFSDYRSISQNARVYVATAVENGLISGYDDGTFKGQNSITRAEAATLLWRAYQYGNDNKTYDDIASTDNTTPSKDNAPSDKNQNENDDSTIIEDEEPVVELEEQKPYVMRKLASANLSSSSMATYDDNNIYYIDVNDNCVYQINISNGKKTKYLDTNNLSYRETEKYESEEAKVVTKTVETGEYEEIEEEITETLVDEETGEETEVTKIVKKRVPITEEVTDIEFETVVEEVTVAEYTSFVPMQVFYDRLNDKLLLNGYYKNLVEAGKSPQKSEYHFIYDITNKSEKVYCVPKWDYTPYYQLPITVALNKDYIVIGGSNYGYKIDVTSGDTYKMWMSFDGESGLKYGNNLYGYTDGNYIYQYVFDTDDCEKITEWIDSDSFGRKDDCYYFWNDDGLIFKISVRNKATTVLDINTLSENVEFEDMGNMRNIDEKFFVIDDETLIFYDTSMKAFRILKKN